MTEKLKPTHKVVTEQLKNCCGIYLMNHFFKHHDPYKVSDYSTYDQKYYGVDQKFIDARNAAEFTETDEQYQNRIRPEVQAQVSSLKNKKSYIIAVLNSEEIKSGAEEVLLDEGFEVLVPETKNPTGSSITFYICHLLPQAKDKKVVTSVLSKKK